MATVRLTDWSDGELSFYGWSWAPLFIPAEFACPCCGAVEVETRFMDRLHHLRLLYARPIRIVPGGGYRCRKHPTEAKKARPGAHTHGRAVDPSIPIGDTLVFLKLAEQAGMTRAGLRLTAGDGHQMHLDDMTAADGFAVRADGLLCWSY
jgi:hypothetical protein